MGDTYFVIAWEALRANKVRSFLTMLGVIIGVMSVVILVALGQASQAYITQQVNSLGAGVLFVMPGNPKGGNAMMGGAGTAQTLTLDDAEAIGDLSGVQEVTPMSAIFTLTKAGNRQQVWEVDGCDATIQNLDMMTLAQGRFYTAAEDRQGKHVAVIGAKVAREMFTSQALDPFETPLKIEGQRYRVVGLLKEAGGVSMGSVDEAVFIPIVTFQNSLKQGAQLNQIMVKVVDPTYQAVVTDQLKVLLRHRHKIRLDEDDDFMVQNQGEILATVGTVTRVFTFLLAGIASISLLVGGIGIMTIMLVSVTERTREIGVRKACGAKRRDILAQFLIESGTISLVGGMVGIGLGALVALAATRAVKLPFTLSPAATIGAFLFSAGVGLFFGLYPANKAAKLDPVDALRFE